MQHQKISNHPVVRFTNRHPTISGYGFILAALGCLVILLAISPYFRYYHECALTPCVVPVLGPVEILEFVISLLLIGVFFGMGSLLS